MVKFHRRRPGATKLRSQGVHSGEPLVQWYPALVLINPWVCGKLSWFDIFLSAPHWGDTHSVSFRFYLGTSMSLKVTDTQPRVTIIPNHRAPSAPNSMRVMNNPTFHLEIKTLESCILLFH